MRTVCWVCWFMTVFMKSPTISAHMQTPITMANAAASTKPTTLVNVSFSMAAYSLHAPRPGDYARETAGLQCVRDKACRHSLFMVRSAAGQKETPPHGIRRSQGGARASHQPDGEPARGPARALFADSREAERDARVRHAGA